MAKPQFVEDTRLKHMLKVASVSSESLKRNVALRYIIYGTGMMLTEVARMPLICYLKPDGSLLENRHSLTNV